MQLLSQAFHQLKILRERAEAEGKDLRFIPRISRRFEPKLIVAVNDHDHSVDVELSLTSLYGYNGILPDYFSDEILREPQSGLRKFLDIFTHRQFSLQFEIWAKHQFFSENTLDAAAERNQHMDQVVLALGGMGLIDSEDSPLFARGLSRCLVGLFQRREKTPVGLRFLLKQFFGQLDIEIDQHVVTFRRIPEHQQTCLNSVGTSLGSLGQFTLGTRMEDSDGSFALNISDLDLETFYTFLRGGDAHKDLIELLGAYTGMRWDCHLNLVLRADEVPHWSLGRMRLGSDSWALSEDAFLDARVAVGQIGGTPS